MSRIRVVWDKKPPPKKAPPPKLETFKDFKHAYFTVINDLGRRARDGRREIGALLALSLATLVVGIMLGVGWIGEPPAPTPLHPVSLEESCDIQISIMIAGGALPPERRTATMTECVTYYERFMPSQPEQGGPPATNL